jgi:hypothetical protein
MVAIHRRQRRCADTTAPNLELETGLMVYLGTVIYVAATIAIVAAWRRDFTNLPVFFLKMRIAPLP